MSEPLKAKKTIQLKELMTLAAYKSLLEFDSSNLSYRDNDIEGLIDQISSQFSEQFKDNLTYYYDEEMEKITTHPAINRLDEVLSEYYQPE